jgi:hypothetical protein
MTARKLESQLEELETRTARPGELLVIWRRPGTDIRAAIAGQRFASGDKVICPEWTGDTEPPSQKWHRNRLSGSMTDQENDFVMQSMMLAAAIEEIDRDLHGLLPFPPMSEEAMEEMPDNELVHAVMEVQIWVLPLLFFLSATLPLGLTLHSPNCENLSYTREGLSSCVQDPPPTSCCRFFASCAIVLLNDFPINAFESTERDLRTYDSRDDGTAEGRCRDLELLQGIIVSASKSVVCLIPINAAGIF